MLSMSVRSSMRWTLLAMGLFACLLLMLQMFLMSTLGDLQGNVHNEEITNAPVILWWTPDFGDIEQYINCGDKQCYFTAERSHILNPRLKTILFYGSNIKLNDLPIPRPTNVGWGLFHEESPRNNPILAWDSAIELFNYSATFSRYSDVPLTLAYLTGEKQLLGTDYFLLVEEKNSLMASANLAPVLYIQSDCDTVNNRDSYVAEMMKYIRVDSYGACLNNRRLPDNLRENYISNLESEEFLRFVGRYKFTLAFENAVCDDYITEKLWRPLLVGSVPIYYGSPSFKDWLPNERSAIAVQDFNSPKQLAEFLKALNNDDERYNQYLTHKLSSNDPRLSNPRILDELRRRATDTEDTFIRYMRAFECLICKYSHDSTAHRISRVTSRQYNCSLPEDMIPNDKGTPNYWLLQWSLDKCAAKLLARHVATGTKIQDDQFHENAFEMYQKGDCDT